MLRPVSRNRALTCALAVLAMGVVGLLCGAEAADAVNMPGLAEYLPGGAAVIALRSLSQPGDAAAQQRVAAQARFLLANRPLDGRALHWLGFHSGTSDGLDPGMLELAGRLGWRDRMVQLALYNAAVGRGDFAAAVQHADAVLRIEEQDDDELAQRLVAGTRIPAFRQAMVAAFRGGGGWAQRWLMVFGGRLDDDCLRDFVHALATGRRKLSVSVADPLIGALVNNQRGAIAAELVAMLGGAPTGVPLNLPWPATGAETVSAQFDWQVDDDYAIEGFPERRLNPVHVRPTAKAYRLMALPEGNYAVEPATDHADLSGWQWSVGCGTQPRAVAWKFEGENAFGVGPDCTVQWIALRAEPGAHPLTALRVVPANVEDGE